jgi:class 3 adenylate cyclase
LVSEAVRDLIREHFRVLENGSRVLKGFSQPIALYSVEWR